MRQPLTLYNSLDFPESIAIKYRAPFSSVRLFCLRLNGFSDLQSLPIQKKRKGEAWPLLLKRPARGYPVLGFFYKKYRRTSEQGSRIVVGYAVSKIEGFVDVVSSKVRRMTLLP